MTQHSETETRDRTDATCPVTGLHVERRPEWTDVELTPGYRQTVELIGGHILHTVPKGHATKEGVAAALALQSSIVSESIHPDAPHVQLADYSGLEGATANARRTFATQLPRRRGIAALVVYRSPPMVRLSMRLFKALRFVPIKLGFTNGYAEGIRLAVDLLHGLGVSGLSGRRDVPGSAVGPPPGSGIFELDGYHLSYETIDGHIIFGKVRGFLGLREIARHLEIEKMVLASVDSKYGEPILVADLSELEGLTAAARRLYVATLRNRQLATPIALYVCFGVNPVLRQAINISRPFLPFRIRIARNRESAFEIARRETRSSVSSAMTRLRSVFSLGGGPASRLRPPEVDDLLQVIADIDWEVEGPLDREPRLAPNHTLAPVVEALELIKAEVDDLLRARRQTEMALRQSEERYREILDTIVDGYYEVDISGRLQLCNDALLDISGYDRSEIDDLDPTSMMDEGNRRLAIDTFRRVYKTRQAERTSGLEMVRRDGTPIEIELSIALVSDHEGQPVGFRGIVRDVTERARAEKERASLEAQLQRSQRMEAIGTLAGGIAHNFNNLLMGIQGNVSLMAQSMDADGPLANRLRTIEALVSGGSKLTSQLLGYARSGRVDLRVTDLNQLVVETTETFSLTRREYRVHNLLCKQALPVEVDPAQIEQVLLNLLINAADAMPRGGDIFLSSDLLKHTELGTTESDLRPGPFAVVAVKDTGCGMDSATLERIFEPFFTTKGLTQGTGLGLASAYGILRAHGGLIEVESAPGEGSTFRILLPAVAGHPASGTADRAVTLKGQGTILVVEDDPAVLEACASMLSLLDYNPICAASGQAAVDIFARRHAEIDLVVLDLILTDLSGGEVFDRIRSIDPSSRVLLASGYSLEGEAAGLLDRGCDDFIQKPFTIEQLSVKLERLLNRTSDRTRTPQL